MADVLGAFEQAVLLGIMRLGDEAYGRAILKEVQARLERDVAPGAVHATLERLERKKLLTSKLGSGTPIRAGRARRYYYRLQPRRPSVRSTRRAPPPISILAGPRSGPSSRQGASHDPSIV